MRAALLILLLLPLAPLAGAQGPPEQALLTDAQGDAHESNPVMVLDTVCASLCPPPDGTPDTAPVPAPPALDLVAVRARDDPDAVVIIIEVASLDAELSGVVDDERGTTFELCWDRIAEGCREAARFFARPSADGGALLGANYAYRDEQCNTTSACGWGIEHRIVPGTPGRIELVIPRGLLPVPFEAGATITNMVARVARLATNEASLAPDDLPPVLDQDVVTSVDTARGSEPYTVQTPRARTLAPSLAPPGLGPGVTKGQLGGEAEADILEVTFVETPTTFTLSHKLAVVSDAPQDQLLRTEWAFQGGLYYILRIEAAQRQRAIDSLACNPSETTACAETKEVPAVFEVVAGAPGHINVTYLRVDIGAPPAGTQTSRAASFTFYGPGGGSGAATDADISGLLPPYVLKLATREAPAPEGAVRVDDAPTDARMPAIGGESPDGAPLEVTHAEAQALAGGFVRLSIGLRDAGPAVIPPGYVGALRAIAIEEAGRTTMAGAYSDGNGERFFCTADTAVLAGSRTMPPEGSRRQVSAETTAAGGPGNITFYVPPDCLDAVAPGETRRALRLGAASFLVRETPAGAPELVVIDEAQSVDAFDLVLVASAAAPIVPPASAAAFPWLLVLLIGAVVLTGGAVVGAVLLRRRPAALVLPAPGVLFAGKYLVEREVGRGGFGAVWLATHVRLERKVVIKQLQLAVATDPKERERFRREARTLARLDHPFVVKVYDVEEVAELAFIVMEFVEGGSLADLRPKPTSLSAAGRYATEVLDALAAIHAAGIVHGDLKPDNVLLAGDRSVRVADFGIAVAQRGADAFGNASSARPAQLDASGPMRTVGNDAPLGTPLFMAPEQLAGAGPTVASDLYACAAVFHHVATGRLLFSPAPMDMESARQAHARGAPDAGEGSLHPAVVAWLRRGLARDPGDRFASAAEMRSALVDAMARAQTL